MDKQKPSASPPPRPPGGSAVKNPFPADSDTHLLDRLNAIYKYRLLAGIETDARFARECLPCESHPRADSWKPPRECLGYLVRCDVCGSCGRHAGRRIRAAEFRDQDGDDAPQPAVPLR